MKKEIERLSKELNLPVKVVTGVYRAYWMFIRKTIENLPLKEDLDKNEFDRLRKNFNLPYLGKLSCDYKKWLNKKNGYNGYKYKKGETDVQSGNHHNG